MGCFSILAILIKRTLSKYCKDGILNLNRQKFKYTQCQLLLLNGIGVGEPQEPVSGEYWREQQYSRNLVNNIAVGISPTGASVFAEEGNELLHNLKPNSRRQYSLNDFELDRVIGQGSYGKVYTVELKETKQIYAMKVIEKASAANNIDRLQTEKRIFEIAFKHPFLVGLHSCFQTLSKLCFVIEFVRGGDFLSHMQRHSRLPERHARFYAAEISLALHFLHRNGIIYRDLKLDNVLLDHEGHIKLTDYGLCCEGLLPGHTTSSFCGTPSYMAPEMLNGDYDFAVDWWALGVILYEMLVGKSPFDASLAPDNPEVEENVYLFIAILNYAVDIPETLTDRAGSILEGFLTKNAAERLGCQSLDSFSEITGHEFFRNIDWVMLEKKQVPPPYKPRLDSDRDLANFPTEFTDEPVYLDDDPSGIEEIDQTDFEGFEFVNTSLLLLEDCV